MQTFNPLTKGKKNAPAESGKASDKPSRKKKIPQQDWEEWIDGFSSMMVNRFAQYG